MEKIIFKMPSNNKQELLDKLADEVTELFLQKDCSLLDFIKEYSVDFIDRETAIQKDLYLSADGLSLLFNNFELNLHTVSYYAYLLRYNDFNGIKPQYHYERLSKSDPEVTASYQREAIEDYYLQINIYLNNTLEIRYIFDDNVMNDHEIIVYNIPMVRPDLFLDWFKEIQLMIDLGVKDVRLNAILDVPVLINSLK